MTQGTQHGRELARVCSRTTAVAAVEHLLYLWRSFDPIPPPSTRINTINRMNHQPRKQLLLSFPYLFLSFSACFGLALTNARRRQLCQSHSLRGESIHLRRTAVQRIVTSLLYLTSYITPLRSPVCMCVPHAQPYGTSRHDSDPLSFPPQDPYEHQQQQQVNKRSSCFVFRACHGRIWIVLCIPQPDIATYW